jgi:hypothetical protein
MLNGSGIRIFTGALLPRSVLIWLVYGRNFILVRHKPPTVGRDYLQTVARILDYIPYPEVANHPQAWCTGRARGGNAERHW